MRRKASAQSGYVLLMVMGALVLMALVIGRYAAKADRQRDLSGVLGNEARAELDAESGLELMLYFLASHRLNANGIGDGLLPGWASDGRWYRLNDKVWASLQDERGLVSINQPESAALRRLLLNAEVDPRRVDRLLDVLADYIDSDNLRHLNGAEAADYMALGLPPPANDFLQSLSELRRMPAWRDDLALIDKIEPALSLRMPGVMNPNCAPSAVLKAYMPGASPAQIDLLIGLRETAPFLNGQAATAATGLPMDNDEYLYHAGDEVRLRVWAVGQPRAREYNLVLDPGGLYGPWVVTRFRWVARPTIPKTSRPPLESPFRVPAMAEVAR